MAGKPTEANKRDNSDIADDLIGDELGLGGNEGTTNVIDPDTLRGSDEYERDDAGNIVYSDRTGKPRRKRGRRSGGSNRTSNGTGRKTGSGNSQAIDTLSKSLMIVHMGLAGVTRFDGFALENKEADALANSISNVLDQFDWQPDPRFMAITGLVTTSATIYGPRLYLYREHLKEKAQDKTGDKKAAVEWPVINGGLSGAS